MKPHLEITENNLAAMEAFAESNDEPIVMVNLMHDKSRVEYGDPALNDYTGLKALARHTSGTDDQALNGTLLPQVFWSNLLEQLVSIEIR